MDYNELNSWIYRTLASNANGWFTFEDLDKLLAKDVPEWTEAIRRSYLRGELGRMIHSGQIKRKKNIAEYQIGDDATLF